MRNKVKDEAATSSSPGPNANLNINSNNNINSNSNSNGGANAPIRIASFSSLPAAQPTTPNAGAATGSGTGTASSPKSPAANDSSQPDFVAVEVKHDQHAGVQRAPSERSTSRSAHSAAPYSKGGLGSTRTDLSFSETTPMHWFTNRFVENDHLEQEFWKQYYHKYARTIRFWMTLLPFACVVYFGLFYAAYLDKIDDVQTYVAVAIVCSGIPAVMAVIVLMKKLENRRIQYGLDLSLLCAFVGFILVDAISNQHNLKGYMDHCEELPDNGKCLVDWHSVELRLQGQDSYALAVYAIVVLSGLMNPIFRSSFIHVAGVMCCYSTCFMIASVATVNYSTGLRAVSFILLIYFSAGFFAYAAHEAERTQRKNFLFEKDLFKKNSHLKERLDRLISAKKKAVDLDSPIEKAMEILRKWRDHTELNDLVGTDVDTMIGILSNPDLFSPDFKKQIKQNELEVDTDIQNWIMYEFVKSPATKSSTTRSVSFGSLVENARHMPHSLHILNVSGNQEKAEQIVAKSEWNADIFTLNEITGGHPLIFATLQILKKHRLTNIFQIPEAKLVNFLKEIESGYLENPFHNRIHAADVTMNMNYIIHRPKVIDTLSDLDKLACILAAAIHDFRHPGYNNAFHIALERPEAITYNDRSVLENYHLAQAFHLMFDPTKDCNILSNLPKQDKKELRDTIIEMVLATDMANHFGIMGQFKSQLQSDFNPQERASKLLMLRIAMKCCDIGHTTKKSELHRNWTVRVSDEFFIQGDKERENNIPVSPFMDRTKEKIHKSQLGFLDFVCKPLFEAWAAFSLEDKELVTGLERNHAYWKDEADREAAKGTS